ncbi:endochitinase-like [Ornithodoros turicata]|uniref:endochitinase-like n=1 Tax=Ornithodoros turicata TaxID=34597 RepID=UPI0031398E89
MECASSSDAVVTVVGPGESSDSSRTPGDPSAEPQHGEPLREETQLENSTSVICIVMTLVVMFSLVVVLQTRITDSTSLQDLVLWTPKKRSTGNKMEVNEAEHDGEEANVTGDAPVRLPVRLLDPPEDLDDSQQEDTNDAVVTFEPVLEEEPLPNPRCFCMIHGSQQGNTPARSCNGTTLDPSALPTHFCTDVAYCCFGFNSDYNITSSNITMDHIKSLPHRTDVTRFWLVVGDGHRDSEQFSAASRDVKLGLMFAMNVLSWLKVYDFHGVLLHWTYPTVQESQLHIKLLKAMKELYKMTGKLVGVVVPFDLQLRERFDMLALVRVLTPYTILVTPPMTWTSQPSFSTTFTSYRKNHAFHEYPRILWETRDNVAKRDGRHHLCYMLSLTGWSFTLPKASNSTRVGETAVGPGDAYPGTNIVGRVALDDVCNATFDVFDDTSYSVVAIDDKQMVSYSNPKTLARLVSKLANLTKDGGCFGVWNLDWDDFCGQCGLGNFPLAETVYKVALGTE